MKVLEVQEISFQHISDNLRNIESGWLKATLVLGAMGLEELVGVAGRLEHNEGITGFSEASIAMAGNTEFYDDIAGVEEAIAADKLIQAFGKPSELKDTQRVAYRLRRTLVVAQQIIDQENLRLSETPEPPLAEAV
ncbi:hypothetical protein KC878_04395 [Candidatus Saccharibacteria bacterium]|nr:hypothetical protein [Candidatus Saccharibacteria bacterium]MCB9821440.1 hypothetical protein [Candidatus Nomurabacteria bacterium]